VGLAFGGEAKTLATTDDLGHATLWQAADGWSLPRPLEYRGRARFVAFSTDGRYLALGGDQAHLAVRDMRNDTWVQFPEIPLHLPTDLKFSPDGRTLAVASYDSPEIVLWDVPSGHKRLTLSGHATHVMRIAFSPDGHALASAAAPMIDSPICIWNLADGRLERLMRRLSGAIQAMAYSPDGHLLATACPHEKTVSIWDVRSGARVKVITGHSLTTHSLAFSPDGRLLATAAVDGFGAVWSVATGLEIRRLEGQADVLRNVAFSPDGRMLAATGNDGDIRFWDVNELFDNGHVE
jgi:WD40 repeat protein